MSIDGAPLADSSSQVVGLRDSQQVSARTAEPGGLEGWRRRAVALLGATLLAAVWPQSVAATSPDFELRAEDQTLKLATTGPRSKGQLRAVLGRLIPGDEVPIELSVASLSGGSHQVFDVALDAPRVVLGGGAFARESVTLSFQTREGAGEGSEELFVLSAVAPSGTRELRFKAVVDEHEPLIALGTDEVGRPERAATLARGGRATFRLRLSNLGVHPGLFVVDCTTPPGWYAGFPDRPTVLKFLGSWDVDLDLTVEASEELASGDRATIRVEARSVRTQEISALELTVENGGHLHVASASGTAAAHLVPPGGETSWVARLFPFDDGPRSLALAVDSSAPGWEASLSAAEAVVDPATGPVEVTVSARAPADAAAGARGDFTLTVSGESVDEAMTAQLAAQVTDLPRIYIVAMDALSEEYLDLDRAGTGPGSPGDWLMPWTRNLMERGRSYVNAGVNLPSATDMNHLNILCGTLTGTLGVPSVQRFFGGYDELGLAVGLFGSRELLRYGPTGERVITLFEGVRVLEPHARGAIVSGKNWVNDLLEDGGETVQISAGGDRGPDYIGRPEPYVLGDPPSDSDRETDPLAHLTLGGMSIGELIGSGPTLVPSDAYTMESALRVIAHEDPEVMYILLGSMDYVQHAMGCAADLSEWDDQGTPSTFDDVNLVNELATREEILDTARDADHQLGLLLEYLQTRGRLDTSYVVVTADHGHLTHSPDSIRIEPILSNAGISPTELVVRAGSSQVTVYDLDEEATQFLETLLEPLGVVYNRAEMETGFDETTATAHTLPRELYSEYWVSQDDVPGIHNRWPSLFVFRPDQTQYLLATPFWLNRREGLLPFLPHKMPLVGGHGGPDTQHVPIILAGPGIEPGVVRYDAVRVHQIVPTLYDLLGVTAPASVDGLPLP